MADGLEAGFLNQCKSCQPISKIKKGICLLTSPRVARSQPLPLRQKAAAGLALSGRGMCNNVWQYEPHPYQGSRNPAVLQ